MILTAPSQRRLRAPLVHATASLLVALVVSAIVFLLWFPGAYATIAGGLNLFFIIVAVDVVSGPLLTAVVANPKKPTQAFRRDVAVIALVQVAALAYGVYVMSLARPVATIFEVDRMRVISAVEVDPEAVKDAPEGLRALSWTGPRTLAAAVPRTREEALQAIDLALGGLDIGNVPKNWRPYESQHTSAWNRAKSASDLERRYPAAHDALARAAAKANRPVDALRFLPLTWPGAGSGSAARCRCRRRSTCRPSMASSDALLCTPAASAEAQGSDAWAGALLGLALVSALVVAAARQRVCHVLQGGADAPPGRLRRRCRSVALPARPGRARAPAGARRARAGVSAGRASARLRSRLAQGTARGCRPGDVLDLLANERSPALARRHPGVRRIGRLRRGGGARLVRVRRLAAVRPRRSAARRASACRRPPERQCRPGQSVRRPAVARCDRRGSGSQRPRGCPGRWPRRWSSCSSSSSSPAGRERSGFMWPSSSRSAARPG